MHRKAGSYIALLAAALLLSACGNQQDEPPPTDTKNPLVEITSPATTTDANYELTGIALDDTGIDSLTYTLNDGDDTELDLDERHFEVSIELQEGSNVIEVTAIDSAGNEGSDSITVTYKTPTDDVTENPVVKITSPATTTDANYELTGIALDGTGIDSLTYALNDGDDTELDLEDNHFEASLTLKAGANDIQVTATDTGGNEDSDSITVNYNAPASGFGIDTDIAARGDTVTVTGQNLGTGGAINIGDAAATADNWTDTEIKFPIPGDAPGGPQELAIETETGTEHFDLFVGVDFPEGTIEELAAEDHPRGTAVRLGEGTYEATSTERIIDGLSLYGQGQDKTTIKSVVTSGTFSLEEALLVVADTTDHVTITDLRLESGLTVISGTAAEPISPASLTAADSGSDRSVTLSNVAITADEGQAAAEVITLGSLSSIGEFHFPGDITFDDVTADFPLLFDGVFLFMADNITVTESSVQSPDIQLAALNDLRVADSNLAATVGVNMMSLRDTTIAASEFEAWAGNIGFTKDSGFFQIDASLPLGSLTVKNSSFNARDPQHDGDAGSIVFQLGTVSNYIDDNNFRAEDHISLSIDTDNTTTFTGNEFVSGHSSLSSTPGFTVDSGELQYGFLEFHDNEFTYLSDADPYFELNGRLLFTDNVVQGHDNTGTALAVLRKEGFGTLDFTATGNTFTKFARALHLKTSQNSSTDGLLSARINDNVFDFPIEQLGAAAVIDAVRKGHVEDKEIDATRNIWGENTDVSVVESYIEPENGAQKEALNVDPLTEP